MCVIAPAISDRCEAANTQNWNGALFVLGGYLPEERRGHVENDFIHIADFNAMLCGLANATARYDAAVDVGMPDINSIDMRSSSRRAQR